MNVGFMDQAGPVTVAVKLDRHSVALAQAAGELCQRLGKKLCLMHVVEPWAERTHSLPFGEADPLWNVTQAVESNARDLALGRLAELASLMPAGVAVTCHVVHGKPEGCIGVEAQTLQSCLLIIGVSLDSVRFVPRGMSTALSLLVSSPVPTCAVDVDSTLHLATEKMRIMLADDLGPDAQTAVDFAFSLAAGLDRATLHHVHVNPLTLPDLEAGLSTAVATAHAGVDPATSAADVYDALVMGLRGKLDARAAAQREYLEAAGGTYLPEVLTGNVHEQLAEAAAATSPSLVVFGRHHAYYTKPFFIGRVPYRSMLALKRPVVVVPND